MGERRAFWDAYSERRRRPIDELVDHNPKHTAGFVRGTLVIFDTLNNLHPDLVIFPYRGAAPISWSLDAWSENFGRQGFNSLNLPIGSRVDTTTGLYSGPSPAEKWKIIAQEMGQLKTVRGIDSLKRPVLVDEVHSGGTISQAAMITEKILEHAFGAPNLNVIAAQDNRPEILSRKKSPKFIDLIANHYSDGIHTQNVLLPLVYVDCIDLLPYILSPGGLPEGAKPKPVPFNMVEVMGQQNHGMKTLLEKPSPSDYLMIMHNPEAEMLFKKLVGWMYRPQRLKALMPIIKNNQDLGASELSEGGFIMDDYEYLMTLLTDPGKTGINHPQSIRDWLCGYYSEIKDRKIF